MITKKKKKKMSTSERCDGAHNGYHDTRSGCPELCVCSCVRAFVPPYTRCPFDDALEVRFYVPSK